MQVFRNDPTIDVIEASSVVRYGARVEPPAGALVHFDGVDPDQGAMTISTSLTLCGRIDQRWRRAS